MHPVDDPSALGLSRDRLARIEPFFRSRYIDTGKLAGMVSLVARRGEVAHLAALGPSPPQGAARGDRTGGERARE